MTLIINIPDDEYKTLKSTGAWNSGLIECVKNGIPIDDVKAEMKFLIAWHDCPIEIDNGNDSWYCQAVNQCLEIIDKHIADMRGE